MLHGSDDSCSCYGYHGPSVLSSYMVLPVFGFVACVSTQFHVTIIRFSRVAVVALVVVVLDVLVVVDHSIEMVHQAECFNTKDGDSYPSEIRPPPPAKPQNLQSGKRVCEIGDP